MATMIYKYDVHNKKNAPISDIPFVREQLGLCRVYRNKLIGIERDRRDRQTAKRLELFPDYDQQEQQLQQAREALQKVRDEVAEQNAKAKKKTANKEQKAEISQAQQVVKAEAAKLKTMKDALWSDPVFAEFNKQNDAEAVAAVKAARNYCNNTLGLYPFSGLGVDDSMDLRKGAPPKFRKWDGSGRLCCQIQHGMTWDEACAGTDTRLRIRQEGKYTICSVRLGSVNRKPRFVDCPIVLHRPLPADAVIKWVYLIAKRVGLRDRYSLCFVLSTEEQKDCAETGRVAVDVGWRLVEGGLRVAYWVGDDGDEGELMISTERISYAQKVEDLQSIRDNHFNTIKAALAAYLDSLAEVPEWLKETKQYLHVIKAKERIRNLVGNWQRMAGDEAIYQTLVDWRKKEVHLYQWEADQRVKFQAWRKDFYRCFWAMLRKRYSLAYAEKLDLAEMRRKAKPEEKTEAGLIPYRNVASVGSLIELATMPLVKLSAEYTTVDCHACGKRCDWNAAADLEHTCEHCGATWDQDFNACMNLLARGTVLETESQLGDEANPSADSDLG